MKLSYIGTRAKKDSAAEKMKNSAIFSGVCLMTTVTLMKWTQTVRPVG